MPVRVELINEAVADLERYATSGNLPLFLKKLLQLEKAGKDAGQPTAKWLTGWRKIVVGDRDWRIIFTTNPAETVATVWVIGDRGDAACYEEAEHRIVAHSAAQPQVASLAEALFQITELLRTTRQTKTRKRR